MHTIEWAKTMTGWGSVLSIEAQERIYYALAGNIAINNCFNAVAVHGAVSSDSGVMQIPSPNYLVPSSFGSLELRQRSGNEFIGQQIDYQNTVNVRKLTLDEFDLPRVDLIKIDIEGMEMEALEGASRTIERSRPIMLIEKIKTDADATAAVAASARLRASSRPASTCSPSTPATRRCSEIRPQPADGRRDDRPDNGQGSNSGGGERSNTSPFGSRKQIERIGLDHQRAALARAVRRLPSMRPNGP